MGYYFLDTEYVERFQMMIGVKYNMLIMTNLFFPTCPDFLNLKITNNFDQIENLICYTLHLTLHESVIRNKRNDVNRFLKVCCLISFLVERKKKYSLPIYSIRAKTGLFIDCILFLFVCVV